SARVCDWWTGNRGRPALRPAEVTTAKVLNGKRIVSRCSLRAVAILKVRPSWRSAVFLILAVNQN
ncbi:MAG TPA: hypothetical protein VFA23_16135, partial [Dongiaceae bacterium]|nr:hypothetical protein [Dongiaceae bacterium]